MTRDTLIVFVKAPRLGSVKTRLAADLGAAAAAALYRVLAEEEIRRTAPKGGEYERLFFHAPPDAQAEMKAWLPGEMWLAQQGADLGARMAAAFDEAFRRGAPGVAIIGSDVPRVSRDHVREAFGRLADHDLVLGPARDGGYYLLALARPCPGVFQGIAWSTPSVLAATAERAGVLGLTVGMLETLPDIDTLEDVRREWDELRPLLADQGLVETLEQALARPRS